MKLDGLMHQDIHLGRLYSIPFKCKKHIERNRTTKIRIYLQEFARGFVIQAQEFYANSLNKFIRAYLCNYFNALGQM